MIALYILALDGEVSEVRKPCRLSLDLKDLEKLGKLNKVRGGSVKLHAD